ncbi:hypothetical protein Ddye_017805 [Dipteronia dyeriana]|uniref:Zinc knuckle CX2CX4HX4C domain-containing protein n=1 Tax=Dipteronia dyeriana TaxID=168575 RepID=A0AAD9U9W7_9ROSI|nr:hypothetical protein Ddye_017805 [Dipteronia dyeriana]
MNRSSARQLSIMVGKAIEIPSDSKECRGKFVRVKVEIDVTRPLKRAIKLRLDEFNSTVTIPIKYERLPEFCYGCGVLGHSFHDCMDKTSRREAMEGSMTKYGDWLRAVLMGRLKSAYQNNLRSENHRLGEEKSRYGNDVEKENDYPGHDDLRKGDGISLVRKVVGQTPVILKEGGKTEKTVVENVSGKSEKGGVRAEVAAELEADRKEVNTVVEFLKDANIEGVDLNSDGVLNLQVVKSPNSQNNRAFLLSPGKPNIRKWKRVARQVNTNKGMIFSPIIRKTSMKQKSRNGSTASKKTQNCKVHLQLSPTIVEKGWADDPGEKRKGVTMEEDVREGKKSKIDKNDSSNLGSAVPGNQGRRKL